MLAMIAALVWFGPHTDQERLAAIVAWASVIGSAAQFLVQLPVVLRLVPALRIQLATHLESVRTVIRNFGPVFVSRGVVQLSAYHRFHPRQLPANRRRVAALGYAQTLYLLPVSLVRHVGLGFGTAGDVERRRAASEEVAALSAPAARQRTCGASRSS